MGIYIHGMKLDGRPHKALFTKRDGEFVMVVETQYSFSDKEIKVYPVEELPPHGRCVDADALVAEFHRLTLGENSLIERFFADGVYAVIDNAPTIIQAESPKEER